MSSRCPSPQTLQRHICTVPSIHSTIIHQPPRMRHHYEKEEEFFRSTEKVAYGAIIGFAVGSLLGFGMHVATKPSQNTMLTGILIALTLNV